MGLCLARRPTISPQTKSFARPVRRTLCHHLRLHRKPVRQWNAGHVHSCVVTFVPIIAGPALRPSPSGRRADNFAQRANAPQPQPHPEMSRAPFASCSVVPFAAALHWNEPTVRTSSNSWAVSQTLDSATTYDRPERLQRTSLVTSARLRRNQDARPCQRPPWTRVKPKVNPS
jgi:hypothetical protein